MISSGSQEQHYKDHISNREEAIALYKALCIDPERDLSSLPKEPKGQLTHIDLYDFFAKYSLSIIDCNKDFMGEDKQDKGDDGRIKYENRLYLAGPELPGLEKGNTLAFAEKAPDSLSQSKKGTEESIPRQTYNQTILILANKIRQSAAFLTPVDYHEIRNHMFATAILNLPKLEAKVDSLISKSYLHLSKEYNDICEKLNEFVLMAGKIGLPIPEQIIKLQQKVQRLLIPEQLRSRLQTERDEAWALSAIVFAKNWPNLSFTVGYFAVVGQRVILASLREQSIAPFQRHQRSLYTHQERSLASEMKTFGTIPEEYSDDEWAAPAHAKFALKVCSLSIFASQTLNRGKEAIERCFKKKTAVNSPRQKRS